MRASRLASCLLAAFVLKGTAADHQPSKDKVYSLRGTVVNGVSARPIPNVELRLSDLHWEEVAQPAMSDSQGQFVFTGLTAGEYILSANSPETGPVFFDELPEPELIQTIHIKPEEHETVVFFRIAPRIKISGTVRDEFGDPVERALVTFHRPNWLEGRVVLDQVQQTTTDDRGWFRVGRLPPGGYVVCARVGYGGPGQPVAASLGSADFASRGAPRVYTNTCYPDTSGSHPALLEIQAGREAEVNLTLAAAPAVSVSGRILNLPARNGIAVRLVSDSKFRVEPPLFTSAGQDGAFVFRGVLPGHYRLEADGNWQQEDGKRNFFTARLPMDIGGVSLDGIELPLELASVVDVVLHGPEGEKVPTQNMQFGLRTVPDSAGNMQWAQADSSTPFRFTALPAGSYRLVTRTDENTCINSAFLGGKNVINQLVTIAPGATAKLDVTVSRNCGTIQARVVRDGQPVPDAKVLLLLKGSAEEPEDLLADYTDEHGEVSFHGLAPGRYRLWAWHVDKFGSFLGPAKLDAAESVVLELGTGKHVTIDVPLLQEGGSR